MIEGRSVELDTAATNRFAEEIGAMLDADDFAGIARRLGGVGSTTSSDFGFWIAGDADAVDLEILIPPAGFDPTTRTDLPIEMQRVEVPMQLAGPFAVAVVDGLAPGTRARFGPLYRARITRPGGNRERLIDPLAVSTPLGAFAPSELIDLAELRSSRSDAAYFEALDGGTPRLGPFVNILQVHVPTATESGTLAGLARTISRVSDKLTAGVALQPEDELWLDYDAIQLLPVEPTIRREDAPPAFEVLAEHSDRLEVAVRPPTSTNWGYDIIIGGSAAVNPTLLESGRPHELGDLAAALHGFSGRPMRLIIDVVFGHADNQALRVMPSAWFTGPDMYGQHLDYRNPIVRAQLLEMQRRKADHGVDGVRVDGAQDFTWWDPEREVLVHDDDFLVEMSDVVQEVAGVSYRPWMIFEDGRPWPRADWEIASTYRAVIERQPHVVQWGPLTFAHNTPFLFTFWLSKWWRLREVAEMGSQWISGCANHDTLRRGSQVDPEARINTYLGEDLPSIIRRAYDHPASQLLFHAFLPGVPMDFLQAIARAPWSFIRNTDAQYALKVWAEESRFLDWRVPPDSFDDPNNFRRLKQLGFDDLALLRAFMAELAAAVAIHGDAIEPVVAAAERAPRPDRFPATVESLLRGSHAWMDDVHDLCTVTRHFERLDPATVRFGRKVRGFRFEHPWLRDDLTADDRFEHLHPSLGAAVFAGLRTGPSGDRLLFVANMEGAPRQVVPAELFDGAVLDWKVALASPGVFAAGGGAIDPSESIVLADGEGLVCLASASR